MQAASRVFPSQEEIQHTLQHYQRDIIYMNKTGVEPAEIKTWLETRGHKIPLNSLKLFIEKLDPQEELKECSKCNTKKPLTEFNKRVKSKDGLQTWCKECGSTANKEHYKANKPDEPKTLRRSTISSAASMETHINELKPFILKLLQERGNEPITVKILEDEHNQYGNVIYNHVLRRLTEMDVLSRKKQGPRYVYWIKDYKLERNIKDAEVRPEKKPEEIIGNKISEDVINKDLRKRNLKLEESLKKHQRKLNEANLIIKYKEDKIIELKNSLYDARKDIPNTSAYGFYTALLANSSKVVIENDEHLRFEINCKDEDALVQMYQKAKELNLNVRMHADSTRGLFKINAVVKEAE